MPEVVVLYTTWPDAEKAEAVATEAVEQGLAACVNIFAGIRSIYRWEGAIEQSAETPMTLKTTAAAAAALSRFLAERHPYELPCILALPVETPLSHLPFVSWVEEQVRASVDTSRVK
jgi:periplasmic divalent cation tolerance protein